MDANRLVFSQIEFSAATADGLQGVAIMTKGEARGHGMVVDDKTIEQFMRLSMGKSIPAYLTHDGAVDDSGRPKDRLGKEIGLFSGFYREGDKVRANFRFLEAFKQAEPKVYGTLLELAKSAADKLGISPVLRQLKVWVKRDGSEVAASGPGIPADLASDLPAMRISDLLSCDFVQRPATNTGLFHAVDESTHNESQTMSAESISVQKHNEELTVLSTQHKDAITALETKHKDAVAALEAKLNDATAENAKAKEKITQLESALAAKANEAEEAAKYDMRKAGAPALSIALEQRAGAQLPKPAESDKGKWEQYAALCEAVKDSNGTVLQHKETPAAQLFREKYLTRK